MADEQKPQGTPQEEAPKPAEKKETPAPITEQSVVDKVSKGETLSPEETEVFKAIPPGAMPAPKAEEKPAEKPAEGDKPKEEKPAEPSPTEVTADRRKLIEAELEKPDNEVDLSKFKSQIELGLYWDLKKQRRKNARLQEEVETERVLRIVERLKGNKPEATPAEEAEDAAIMEIIKDLKPDDIVTVADIQAALKKKEDAKKAAKEKAEKEPPKKGLLTAEQIRVEKLEAESHLRSRGLDDFHEVTEYAEAVLKDDADAIEILRETARSGGNTALKTYFLIKGSKHWPAVEKQINELREKAGKKPASGKPEVPADNKRRAEKIDENEGKTRVPAGGGATPASKEFTVGEIANMSAKDVRKLSKEQRKQILETFGC